MKRLAVWALAGLTVAALATGCSGQQGSRGGGGATATEGAGSPTNTSTSDMGAGTRDSAITYVVKLIELNDSGVSGDATVTVTGTSISVVLDAKGLTPNEKHPQHIHGFRNRDRSQLPTETTDLTDMDSEAAIGPPLLALEPFPTADSDGSITYEGSFSDVGMIFPLAIRAIEIHGLSNGGRYDFNVPVAAGILKAAISAAPGGTGGPGAGGMGGTAGGSDTGSGGTDTNQGVTPGTGGAGGTGGGSAPGTQENTGAGGIGGSTQ